ncbi:enoyl-CoA hydratase/isomerase family protein [Novosphingobium sp. G106]|uniref:enoyl-CoA hydratase/isomerase family protein n=1 Tax=Novosphingobium sp. G106 TaxID=2849500 RepID=UPI001C2D019C|nr:enoyl-CoA hydratase-related protein [Novosphingobium sp. G106]MBV1688938.1 enoyl-CoA hydratase/isomerase family protein [Novosphingobium sp. G106]
MSDTQDEILTDCPAPGVLRITLNRPDAGNAFTFAMYERLAEIFTETAYLPDVQAVILTATGRMFSVGHDLQNGGSSAQVPSGIGAAHASRLSARAINQLPALMRALPQPIIAAVNGTAAGAGYGLALNADLTIAARSAKFVNAFHNAGTGHEFGLSYLLPRAVGTQRAMELLLTGRHLPAEEAREIGLILRVVDDAALMDEALALADAIMLNAPLGTQITKQSVWLNLGATSLEAAMEMETRGQAVTAGTADRVEKRAAFFEKRRPEFKNQ